MRKIFLLFIFLWVSTAMAELQFKEPLNTSLLDYTKYCPARGTTPLPKMQSIQSLFKDLKINSVRCFLSQNPPPYMMMSVCQRVPPLTRGQIATFILSAGLR